MLVVLATLLNVGCKQEEKNTDASQNIEVSNISAEEQLKKMLDSKKPIDQETFKNEMLPLIQEVSQKNSWPMVEHIANKAVSAPNKEIFTANYKDLEIQLLKKLNK